MKGWNEQVDIVHISLVALLFIGTIIATVRCAYGPTRVVFEDKTLIMDAAHFTIDNTKPPCRVFNATFAWVTTENCRQIFASPNGKIDVVDKSQIVAYWEPGHQPMYRVIEVDDPRNVYRKNRSNKGVY